MWGTKKPEANPSPTPEPVQPVAAARPPVPAPAPVRAPAPSGAEGSRSEPSRIAQSLTFKGEITGREDIYLDGAIEGAIRLPESRVTVGPNGRVAADIEAGEIVIEGFVQGSLSGRTRVELRRSSAVRGDIVAPRLAVQEGARFTGKVDMVRPEDVRASRAAAASASAGAEDLRTVPLGTPDPVS